LEEARKRSPEEMKQDGKIEVEKRKYESMKKGEKRKEKMR
jgi:hypothetical protein